MRRVCKRRFRCRLLWTGLWTLAMLLPAGHTGFAQTAQTLDLAPPSQHRSAASGGGTGRQMPPAHGGAQRMPPGEAAAPLASTPILPAEPNTKLAEAFDVPPPFAQPGMPLSGGMLRGDGLLDALWGWQLLPQGTIYRSYLAGVRESRMASAWNYERHWGWMWDIALGGRAGMLRYGNQDPLRPEGFQIDIEGAAFPRLDLERDLDLVASDFRFGIPLTYGRGRYQTKLAYYHLSAHLGDEWMLRTAGWTRINYTRNALVWGHAYSLTDNLRLYAEAAWAFDTDGGAEPWEFQFGVDYSPLEPAGSLRGSPFVALNAHLREEVDFGGNFVVQAGWQWRGPTGGLFRMGMQYFAGKSEQYEFFQQYEDKAGLGLWYDF